VQLLIERGANLEAMNRRGQTPLALAFRALEEQSEWTPTEYSVPIAAALLDAGARVQSANMTLAAAACLDRPEDVARLARDAEPRDLQIALAAVAFNGNTNAITTLIELGADPNACNIGLHPHATALHNAVCSGSLEAVKRLVEAGARPNAKDAAYRATPLDWAEYFVRQERDPAKQDAEIAAYLRGKENEP
jgi:peptide-methionine (S)-S-oxide reductase